MGKSKTKQINLKHKTIHLYLLLKAIKYQPHCGAQEVLKMIEPL